MEQRKRARTEEPFQSEPDDGISMVSDEEIREPPKSFLCPLTMEVMFDPVLDSEGNTYERSAILEWLKNNRTSPISRQPLNNKMIIPNNALRDAIHEFMGLDWVEDMMSEHSQVSNVPLASQSAFRAKIDCYLEKVSQTICGGLELKLNDKGCCAFRYDNITIVVDVPEKAGIFCLYTRDLVPMLTDSMKDLLLELNFMQGDTRGGCLSAKKHESGYSEVLFSYSDRVSEVSEIDFQNILVNFVETAENLRGRLLKHITTDAHAKATIMQVVSNASKEGKELDVASFLR